MEHASHIDPAEFVSAIKPALERKDLTGLVSTCKSRWTATQIVSLLSCDHCDARKVAALALALVGQSGCLCDLYGQLSDPDPMVNQMAEHAIWSIWFRSDNEEANHELLRGAKAIERQDFPHAIGHLNRALALKHDFAEAFNQRAIARYLQDDLAGSIEDCRHAVKLIPEHFGAWCGMGHCHAQSGCLRSAIECYEKALSINPHLCEIRQAVCDLRAQLSKPDIGK